MCNYSFCYFFPISELYHVGSWKVLDVSLAAAKESEGKIGFDAKSRHIKRNIFPRRIKNQMVCSFGILFWNPNELRWQAKDFCNWILGKLLAHLFIFMWEPNPEKGTVICLSQRLKSKSIADFFFSDFEPSRRQFSAVASEENEIKIFEDIW